VLRNESIRSTERLAMLLLCSACQSHSAAFVTCVMTTGFVRDRLYRISVTVGTVCVITAYSVMLT
jgi:hypothetical protein